MPVSPHVAELMLARRALSNVLTSLSISAEDMTAMRLIELLDYFAENPSKYLDLIND